MVVDFPAPFGPRKPVTIPGRTVKVRSSTATLCPYRLVSPRTSIISPVLLRMRRHGPTTLAGRGRAVGRAHGGRLVGFSSPRRKAGLMACGSGGGYRAAMNTQERSDARRRASALTAALGAMRSARSWRATLHALLGLPLGLGACTVLAGLVVVWGAAVWSLIDGPTGAPVLAVVYVLVAVASPLPLLWCVQGFGAVQRARFRAVLGVEIAAPPSEAGSWPLRPVRPWRAPATWRQLGYHLLALVIGTVGGALVATCWSAPALAVAYAAGAWGGGPRPGAALAVVVLALALLPAAPWVARGVARVDGAAAGRCSVPAAARSWHSGSSRWRAAAPRSWPRPTPNAAASSATSTTARNSDWSPWRCTSAWRAPTSPTRPSRPGKPSRRPTTKPPRPSPSCATSSAACTRPCSTTAVSTRPSPGSRHARRSRSGCASRWPGAARRASRPSPTSSSPRRSPTSPSTPTQARPRSPSHAPASGCASSSATTAAVARPRRTAAAAGCAGWRSGPPRWTGRWPSTAHQAGRRPSPWSCRANRDRRGLGPAPRRPDQAARRRRLRGRRRRVRRRAAAASCRRAPPRPARGRRAHAADPHRRGHPGRARDPPPVPGGRRGGAVPVRRGALRHRPAVRADQRGRVPPQGPRRPRVRLPRRAAPGGRRWHRARPRGRRPAPGPPPQRPDRPPHPARAAGAAADGGGALQQRHRRRPERQPERGGEVRQQHLQQAGPLPHRHRPPAGERSSLQEDVADVLLHRARADVQGVDDAVVGAPLRHQPQHLLLAQSEAVDRVAAAADQELGDDLGVERGATGGHPAQRVEEVGHVGDAVLEEVPDPAGPHGQQVGGVALLDVLGQHHHGDLRVLAADHERGPDALVGVGRRHAHVDHDQVGVVLADSSQQLLGVGHGGGDLEAAVAEQLGQAFAEQDRVLGDHDSHGSSTVMVVGPPGGLWMASVPSTAAARRAPYRQRGRVLPAWSAHGDACGGGRAR